MSKKYELYMVVWHDEGSCYAIEGMCWFPAPTRKKAENVQKRVHHRLNKEENIPTLLKQIRITKLTVPGETEEERLLAALTYCPIGDNPIATIDEEDWEPIRPMDAVVEKQPLPKCDCPGCGSMGAMAEHRECMRKLHGD
jgi:hypothetical protein